MTLKQATFILLSAFAVGLIIYFSVDYFESINVARGFGRITK